MKDDKRREPLPVVYLGQLAGLSPNAGPNSGTSHTISAEALERAQKREASDDKR